MKILKILIILIISGLLSSQNSNKISTINRISSTIQINKGDLICIIFIYAGECEKCHNQTLALLNSLADSVKSSMLKPLLAVNVNRSIDLQLVLKKFTLNQIPAIAKSNKVQEEYGLSRMDYFLLIDHNGKELNRINLNDIEKNFNKELKKLIQISRDYLKKK